MSPAFSVTEPHPTVPNTGAYIGGGRGGAGNFKHYRPEQLSKGPDASGPASRIALSSFAAGRRSSSSSSSTYHQAVPAGRGGAGNMVRRPNTSDSGDEAMFKFDEEISRRSFRDADNAAPVYRVGRGGAGNTFGNTAGAGSHEVAAVAARQSSRLGSADSSASISSAGSDSSVRRSLENAFGRFSRKLSARP